MNIDYVVEDYAAGCWWKKLRSVISPHRLRRPQSRSVTDDESRTAPHDAGLGSDTAQREAAPLRHATVYEQMLVSSPQTSAH